MINIVFDRIAAAHDEFADAVNARFRESQEGMGAQRTKAIAEAFCARDRVLA